MIPTTSRPTSRPTMRPTTSQPTIVPASNEYNLINPYPECIYANDGVHEFCHDIYDINDADSIGDMIHPNYEERLTATLINMARLHPDIYKTTKYGFSNSGYDYYYEQEYCGIATSVPLYYNQKMNEAARWHSWDQANCNPTVAHLTCSDRCSRFEPFTSISNQPVCWAGTRWTGFQTMKPDDTVFISGEGICGGNGCYNDGHCSAMFNPGVSLIGIGKWKGVYGYDILYGYYDEVTPHDYPIVYGAHLDGRYYWNEANSVKDKLTFILEYYGPNINNDRANKVYLLFKSKGVLVGGPVQSEVGWM
eukprot:366924_1